jgi:hypothetical protein
MIFNIENIDYIRCSKSWSKNYIGNSISCSITSRVWSRSRSRINNHRGYIRSRSIAANIGWGWHKSWVESERYRCSASRSRSK